MIEKNSIINGTKSIPHGRNSELDILKFVFAIMIVLCHTETFHCAYLAVDFFFIVSAFFMCRAAYCYDSMSTPPPKRKTYIV